MKNIFSNRKYYINKIRSDNYYRSLVIATFSSGWNLIYATYHFFLAFKYNSYWFLTMGVYYLIACLMKTIILRLKDGDTSKNIKALKTNGIMMFALGIVFSGVILLSIIEKRNNAKSTIVAITMATYTFYLVIKAIINIVKIRKFKTIKFKTLKNISMVFALGSLYGLERMMLGTFGNVNDNFTLMTEIMTGTIIYIIIMLFGINLLNLAKRYQDN